MPSQTVYALLYDVGYDQRRDLTARNYTWAERVSAYNLVLRSFCGSLAIHAPYLVSWQTTVALVAAQQYIDLPDGSGADPEFWQIKADGAYIAGESSHLELADPAYRINWADNTDNAIPTKFYLRFNDATEVWRMYFDCPCEAGLTLNIDYLKAPSLVTSAGDITTDATAQTAAQATQTPWGGRFDHILRPWCADWMLRRNEWSSDDYRASAQMWASDAIAAAQQGEYAPIRKQPIFSKSTGG